MNDHPDDTIVAIATAPGGASRGIVRLCGRDAVQVAATLCNSTLIEENESLPTTPIVHAADIDSIPCDLYIWPTARSFARSPTVEIHSLGSPPLLDKIVRRACAAGARLAEPGEFTLRAFLAGRIDLTQAEAVLGVIDAQGDEQLRTALGQLAGGLAKPLVAIRGDLLDLLAELEAGLDFAEEDLEFISAKTLQTRIQSAFQATDAIAQQVATRSESGPSFRVVLTGPPNAGKSSLFNALAGESAAIVSPLSGTTRDYLSARIEIDNATIELIDTAGLDDLKIDPVDQTAQRMAHEQCENADVRLICLDATRPVEMSLPLTRPESGPPSLTILTKCDLVSSTELKKIASQHGTIPTSCVTGMGLIELRQQLQAAALQRRESHVVPSTAARCRESLGRARESLLRAATLATQSRNDDLIAAEIRCALAELGNVAGTVCADDILDRVFSRFCIGK